MRRVLLHRPDLELRRLTPSNCEDLLFDDVLWVKRARQEHDAFADALTDTGLLGAFFVAIVAPGFRRVFALELPRPIVIMAVIGVVAAAGALMELGLRLAWTIGPRVRSLRQ